MKVLYAAYSLFILMLGFVVSRVKPSSTRAYIVGSNYGGTEDPNALAMVRYLSDNGQHVIVIGDWCQDKAALNLRRGSLRAAYHFFNSAGCFFTHSLSDIIPFAHQFGLLARPMRFPSLVFMQHGVIGLKRMLSSGVSMADYILSLEPCFDKMVISSMREKELVESFGVPSHKLVVTGLPRFDFYSTGSDTSNTILVFFTWQEAQQLSTKLREVLHCEALLSLEQQGYKVVVGIHPMQRSRFVGVTAQEFQEAIHSCRLLITDDSSLAWDVFYRGQQVVFYQAADDWLSDDAYLLERRCSNAVELNQRVLTSIERGSVTPFEFAAFNDQRNSERVFALLDNQN